MAFPDDPLGVRVDLQVDGTWTDVTGDAYTRTPITITRGQQDGAAVADPSRCTVTLNNKDGRYSPRNPVSPYYGKIGRNTPIRVGVRTGPSYLLVTGAGGASTPDTAAIDITGDIDVRFDATLDNWVVSGSTDLAGKFSTAGNQRSWMLQSRDGRIHFEWSPDGATTIQADSTELAPLYQTRRAAWRVTLDVNNGSGGWTCEFYTARTMAGPWVKLGNSVTGAGVTSIFNSANSLAVGDATNLAYTKPRGQVHAFELRNGINGTLVASPDFTTATPGASSFTDSVGRVWNRSVTASFSNFHVRHVGDVSSWPPRWAPSGQDVWTSLDASGILRRLGQGRKALDSTLRRRLPSQASLLAYWPCEEEAGATQAYSPLPGGQPLTVSRWDFGQDDSLGGSSPLPVIAPGGTMRGSVPPPPAPSTTWALCLPYRVDGTPPVADQEMLSWTTTGTVRRWRLMMSATTTILYGYDSAGALVLDSGPIIGGPEVYDGWWRLELVASQSGGTVNWLIRWTKVNGGSTSVGSSFSGTVGAVTGLDTTFGPGLPDIRVGHVSVWSADVIGPAYAFADHGFNAETAASRLQRLSTEEARTVQIRVPTDVPLSDSTLMGPQRPDTLTALLQQCADSDLGTLLEDPQSSGLIYKRRQARYNQVPTLVLDYSAGEVMPPLEPVDDDQATRNDITVSRVGGSSARAVLESGPMSVQAPPLGVGLYDTSTTLSLANDDQPQQHAQWLLHLGTWDESRVPTVQIALHKHPHLIEQFLSLELGDRIQITNTPTWLPPGPIDLIVQGITETLGIRTWTASLTCVPAGPWNVGVADSPEARVDTSGCVLGAAISETDTALVLVTTLGAPWITTATHPAELPVDLQVGGEQIRATAITAGVADAFGRTVASSWGTADAGGTWAQAGGVAADYAVSGGIGTHTLSTVNVSRRSSIPGVHPDGILSATISVSAVATGASLFGGLVVRALSGDDVYYARVEFTTAGGLVLALRERTGGTETTLATATLPYSYTAGAQFRLRFQAVGTTLQARLWPVAEVEPGVWQVTAVDSTLTAAGSVGCRSISATGNTNVSPIVRYDDLLMSSPQRATVVRSLNGIAKPHAAGAPVSLHKPTTVAL